MITSVSPAARALMTRSRSPMTTTSATAGLATETRVTGTGRVERIASARPAARSATMSCSAVCARSGRAERRRRSAARRSLTEGVGENREWNRSRVGAPVGRIRQDARIRCARTRAFRVSLEPRAVRTSATRDGVSAKDSHRQRIAASAAGPHDDGRRRGAGRRSTTRRAARHAAPRRRAPAHCRAARARRLEFAPFVCTLSGSP